VPELLLAVHAGREQRVKQLLAEGADVNAADADGLTPLMACAMNGCPSLAKVLLSAGADSRLRNAWGMTAQSIARWHGHLALADRLSQAECTACQIAPPQKESV